MKKITVIWLFLMFALTLSLIFIGFNVSKKKVPYKALENDIVEAMKVYYGQDENLKKLPTDKKLSRITIGELESFGININNIIKNDTCDGYGTVKKEAVAFSYKAYIKCDNYQTKGYNSK